MSQHNTADNPFLAAVRPWFQIASDNGLPLFQPTVQGSNPINSSPYVIEFADFSEEFGRSAQRALLISRLDALIAELRRDGIETTACLIGGSMIDRDREPRDLDCAVFYRAAETVSSVGLRLSEIGKQQLAEGIDARFVPVDSDPLIIIKMTSYFTSLYGASRHGSERRLGHVLVLPQQS